MGYYKYDGQNERKSSANRWVRYVAFSFCFVSFGIHALLYLGSFLRLYRHGFDIDTANIDPRFALWCSFINFIVFTVLLLLSGWFLYKRKTVMVIILFVSCGVLAVISGFVEYLQTR